MHFFHSRNYRRSLPHIIRADRPLFVTFSTVGFRALQPGARTIALRHALHSHGSEIYMYVAVVMPEHMHLIFRLIRHDVDFSRVMKGIKGVSSRRMNQLLGWRGSIWRDESLDHVVRNAEWSRAKIEYVCNNPVRRGLVRTPDEYMWLWRSWVEGGNRGRLDQLD